MEVRDECAHAVGCLIKRGVVRRPHDDENLPFLFAHPRHQGVAGFGPFNPLLRSQITSLMPAQCGARLAMLAVIAPAASAYSLFGTSSRSHAVTAQIAAQAPVAAQVPFAHTAVQMRTRNTAVQMSEAPAGGKKKVFVLGGDGFCGWPTALHLSNLGHDVVIIDDLSRRKIDVELGASSLTPISTPEVRVATWNEMSGKDLKYVYMDLANEYDRFLQLIKDEKPDTMVHFAEQRAAPYSMKNSATKRYTIENNMGATHNALCAIVESELDVHLVHLGTMGVYGYGNSGGEIPEGYIDVTLPGGREKNILHPAYPGSIYHSTKRAAPPLQLEPSPSTLRHQPRPHAPARVPPPRLPQELPTMPPAPTQVPGRHSLPVLREERPAARHRPAPGVPPRCCAAAAPLPRRCRAAAPYCRACHSAAV